MSEHGGSDSFYAHYYMAAGAAGYMAGGNSGGGSANDILHSIDAVVTAILSGLHLLPPDKSAMAAAAAVGLKKEVHAARPRPHIVRESLEVLFLACAWMPETAELARRLTGLVEALLAISSPGQSSSSSGGPGGGSVAELFATPTPADPPRFLKGQCLDTVPVDQPFSVLVSIVRSAQDGGAALKPFRAGSAPRGTDVTLVLHAPGVRVLSGQRQVVRVLPDEDSEPVMFELQVGRPGPCRMSVTAWCGGVYLGELLIETEASNGTSVGYWYRDFTVRVGATDLWSAEAEGAVSLVVRYDAAGNAYRFEFRDEDNPYEVTSKLAYAPGSRLKQLVEGLDQIAKGRSGYSPSEARDYLVNAGVGLWQELIPQQLRDQFWQRQGRIRQLTILADSDTVPWELLYPLDKGHDAGFLVEQFPVTRMVFGCRPARSLSLSPSRFVLPDNSPPMAASEVEELSQLLGPPPGTVVAELTPLLDLIRAGNFGLLHFACHNAFDITHGSAIRLDKKPFTPPQLNKAVAEQVLARSAPTVFINACHSAGASPSYHQLDGFARQFLAAGAGAFIGSLWAVRDSAARGFVAELYTSLRSGKSLGDAAMRARQAAAGDSGDPTWLAYAVYGDPRATVQKRPAPAPGLTWHSRK
jgi:CHAT domain